MNLTSAEYSRAFKMLDKYARGERRAYLAELFPSKAEAEYMLCFRPLGEVGLSGKACLYIQVETTELKSACKAKVLPESLVERLAAGLSTLGRSG